MKNTFIVLSLMVLMWKFKTKRKAAAAAAGDDPDVMVAATTADIHKLAKK